jgi:hypothetical protein
VLRGHDGRVRASLTVNDRPERWGYHLLGLSYSADASRGFPVVEAEVDFAAEGYAAWLGWVQVVWMNDDVIVDRAPQLLDSGVPYVTFGVRPAFFDAPSTTVASATWRARTFLTATPDLVMTKVVEPVAGFTWGYDLEDGRVDVVGLAQADADDWPATRTELTRELPHWEFR